MSTINYASSDYITMGARIMSTEDLLNDPDYVSEFGTDLDTTRNYINDCYENDFENIKCELEKHNFYYYHIVLKYGYYEGFYLDIENNFGVAYDSYEDKRYAQKEITEIKHFLYDCAGLGLAAVHPGWGTTEFDYSETIKHINNAIKEMRNEVKMTPTWAQYERG